MNGFLPFCCTVQRNIDNKRRNERQHVSLASGWNQACIAAEASVHVVEFLQTDLLGQGNAHQDHIILAFIYFLLVISFILLIATVLAFAASSLPTHSKVKI